MEKLILIPVIISCIMIIIEDFRMFKIRLLWFLVLLPFIAVNNYIQRGMDAMTTFLVNILILTVLFSITYFSMYLLNRHKYRSVSKIFGGGDLLMIIAFVFQFEPMAFIETLLISFVAILFIHFSIQRINHHRKNTIPLAGYLSAVFIIAISLSELISIHLHSDLFWMNLIYTNG